MATELDINPSTLALEERTWKVVIDTEVGIDPIITVFREVVVRNEDGSVLYKDKTAPMVSRRLSQVMDQTFNGVTVAQMAGLIAMIADTWRQEDRNPPQE